MSLKLGELEVLDYEADLPRMDSNHDKVIQSLLWGFFAVLQRGAAWRFPSTETEFDVRSFAPFRIENERERSTPA
jgi:hypothetical protein